MSKSELFNDIPIHHVMAFNAVSAPAFIGQASAVVIDCSLDDEADLGVIIVAKSKYDLERFFEFIECESHPAKFKEVAVTHTAYLRVRKQADIQGEHGVLNPNHQDLEDEL